MGLTSDISKLKVPELKKELKQRGLNTTGNKNELIDRLQKALSSPSASTELSTRSMESFILEDELLNDDDDDHTASGETVLDSDVEKVLEESSGTPQALKKVNSLTETANGIEKKTKKIKLLRDIPNVDQTINKPKNKNLSESISSKEHQSKIIKLSGISIKERLELRAKKFGVELSGSAKLLARAERFGSVENEPKHTEMDKLKKRAERFGGSVAKEMTSLDMEEKLKARKARFAAGK